MSAGGNSARELLTKVQDFVDDAKTVEYEGDIETEFSDPAAGGGAFVQRGTLEESAIFPNRGRSVLEFPDFLTETIYVKKDVYIRDGESRTKLEETKFGKLDPDAPGSILGTTGEFALFERPQDLGDALQAAQRPEILREGDGQLLVSVTFPPGELLSSGIEPFEEATGELVVTSEGRPKRLTLNASGPDSRLEVAIRFTRWNGRVRIEAPKRADLDATPFIDEEAVAAYEDAALYQPGEIPDGWEAAVADVITAEQSVEGCAQVEVLYVDPEDELAGYMDMYMFPTACGSGAPPGSEEFIAGPYRGFTYRDPQFGGAFYEIDVNGTRVQVDTDLPAEVVASILADLVPLDLDNPPAATAPATPAV